MLLTWQRLQTEVSDSGSHSFPVASVWLLCSPWTTQSEIVNLPTPGLPSLEKKDPKILAGHNGIHLKKAVHLNNLSS